MICCDLRFQDDLIEETQRGLYKWSDIKGPLEIRAPSNLNPGHLCIFQPTQPPGWSNICGMVNDIGLRISDLCLEWRLAYWPVDRGGNIVDSCASVTHSGPDSLPLRVWVLTPMTPFTFCPAPFPEWLSSPSTVLGSLMSQAWHS